VATLTAAPLIVLLQQATEQQSHQLANR
jgi:hypothetical protein